MDIKVQVRLSEKNMMLAQATVTFDEIIETKGWRIMKSTKIHDKYQEMIWIQPPSYRAGSQWKNLVFVNDKKLYAMVEDKIYDTYSQTRKRTPPKEDEVSVEDIPF